MFWSLTHRYTKSKGTLLGYYSSCKILCIAINQFLSQIFNMLLYREYFKQVTSKSGTMTCYNLHTTAVPCNLKHLRFKNNPHMPISSAESSSFYCNILYVLPQQNARIYKWFQSKILQNTTSTSSQIFYYPNYQF